MKEKIKPKKKDYILAVVCPDGAAIFKTPKYEEKEAKKKLKGFKESLKPNKMKVVKTRKEGNEWLKKQGWTESAPINKKQKKANKVSKPSNQLLFLRFLFKSDSDIDQFIEQFDLYDDAFSEAHIIEGELKPLQKQIKKSIEKLLNNYDEIIKKTNMKMGGQP